MNYTPRTQCRICTDTITDGPLPILDLGFHPLPDKFKTFPGEAEEKFPLRVGYCSNCHLVQLLDDVNEDVLWNDEYAFYTGASPSSIKYFEKYAVDTINRFPDLVRQGLTVEIASNDGTYLEHFVKAGYRVLGVEPTRNTADEAIDKGVDTIVKLFTLETAKEIKDTMGQASLIVGSNVLAHVPDPHNFLEGVKTLLTPDGVCIFEVQYFPHLIFNNAFDHVYHEHRSFFSLHPLNKLFSQHGLKIFDVQEADTQGGSIRIFATKKKVAVRPSVAIMLDYEKRIGILDRRLYEGMQYHVDYLRDKLLKMIKDLKKQGKEVWGYGASAKGNTLLNYCGITRDLVWCIVDKTPFKFGKYTPGTNILVVNQDITPVEPDKVVYLVLVWNYLSGILEREKDFQENGGRFLVPIPMPVLI